MAAKRSRAGADRGLYRGRVVVKSFGVSGDQVVEKTVAAIVVDVCRLVSDRAKEIQRLLPGSVLNGHAWRRRIGADVVDALELTHRVDDLMEVRRLDRRIGREQPADRLELRAVVRQHLIEEEQVRLELPGERLSPRVRARLETFLADAVRRRKVILDGVVPRQIAPSSKRDGQIVRTIRLDLRGRLGRQPGIFRLDTRVVRTTGTPFF